MPYTVLGGILEVQYKCGFCGHEDEASSGEVDEYVGNMFTVSVFQCEKCGANLAHDDGNDMDWDDPEYDEDEN